MFIVLSYEHIQIWFLIFPQTFCNAIVSGWS